MTKPIRYAPLEFWRIAEHFLHVLHNLFGAPENVAADHTLTARAYKLLASWLSVGEALLRRLLLIEAAAYANLPAALQRAHIKRPRVRKLMSFTAEQPEAWRVSLRCPIERQQPAGARLWKKRAAPKRFYSAWPLAERYEALLRVFNDPTAFAKRLARRLRAKPSHAETLLKAPPAYIHRIDRAEDIDEAARRAAPKCDSS